MASNTQVSFQIGKLALKFWFLSECPCVLCVWVIVCTIPGRTIQPDVPSTYTARSVSSGHNAWYSRAGDWGSGPKCGHTYKYHAAARLQFLPVPSSGVAAGTADPASARNAYACNLEPLTETSTSVGVFCYNVG